MTPKGKNTVNRKILLALLVFISVAGTPICACTNVIHAPSGFTAAAGNQQNILSWHVGNDDDQVLIRYETSSYPASVTDGVLLYRGNEMSYVHNGLDYRKTYYYTIWSARPIDEEWVYSRDNSLASGSPYWLAPSDFMAAAGNQQNTLSWLMGSDDDQVLIRYDTSNYPASVTDGVLVYRGNEMSYIHAGLEYGETYYYTIWSARLIDDEWIYSTENEVTSAIPYWQGPDGEEIHEYVEQGLTRVVGADGEYIELINNHESHDPTWEELKQFLSEDETDQQLYDYSSFVCADFAEMLHNNAENAGIRAAYVSIDFHSSSIGHALNAFDTIDRGLVYIDCTSSMSSTLDNYDKVAYIQVGSEYGLVSLEVAESPQYEYYEEYTLKWKDFNTRLDSYNTRLDYYNTQLAYYNINPSSSLYQWLRTEYNWLNTELTWLQSEEELLGTYWEPMGVVKDYEIFW